MVYSQCYVEGFEQWIKLDPDEGDPEADWCNGDMYSSALETAKLGASPLISYDPEHSNSSELHCFTRKWR